jgi:hypothetical protein
MNEVRHARDGHDILPLEDIMAETHLALTDEERDYLLELLERMQKETRVEEHRTRTPTYRQHVIRREDVIAAILGKLKVPV